MIFTLGWPLLLIGIANATQYPDIWKALRELPVGQIIGMTLVSIFSSLLIGFSEEIFFRGGVYNFTKRLFKKETVKKSEFLNGVLFGLIHAVNYFNGGQYFWDTTNQILYAAGIGWLLAMIYELSGNLWVPILLHAWIDTTDLFFGAANRFQSIGNAQYFQLSSLILFAEMIFFTWFDYRKYQHIKDNSEATEPLS